MPSCRTTTYPLRSDRLTSVESLTGQPWTINLEAAVLLKISSVKYGIGNYIATERDYVYQQVFYLAPIRVRDRDDSIMLNLSLFRLVYPLIWSTNLPQILLHLSPYGLLLEIEKNFLNNTKQYHILVSPTLVRVPHLIPLKVNYRIVHCIPLLQSSARHLLWLGFVDWSSRLQNEN